MILELSNLDIPLPVWKNYTLTILKFTDIETCRRPSSYQLLAIQMAQDMNT